MANLNDLTSIIQQAAGNPLSVETDKLKATARSAADLIAMDRYLKANAAMAAGVPLFGLFAQKLITPGCTGNIAPGGADTSTGEV